MKAGRSIDWLATGKEPQPHGGVAPGLSDGFREGSVARTDAVSERLKKSRLTNDAAVIAADYEPPRVVREALRTLIYQYDISIDDVAMLVDAMKNGYEK